jgi:hypothetical protein
MGICSQRRLEKPWKKVLPFVLLSFSPPDCRPFFLLLASYLDFAHYLQYLDTTAGVRGTITRYVTTIPTASATYHFYELDVTGLDQVWLESNERVREWFDFGEAVRRIQWKQELAQGLMLSSLAPPSR